jgi:hypothetical protein
METSVRTLVIRVGELQLERQRLRWERATREELERNRGELVRAQHELAVALGAAHSREAAA